MSTYTHILDFLADAVARYRIEGERGIEWVWERLMTSTDHARFDLFLVNHGDVLATVAGPPYERFRRRVIALATNTHVNDVK